MQGLRANFSAAQVEGGVFGSQIEDDSDHHASRHGWMLYKNVYAVQMKKGGWIFALGEPCGSSYLRSGLQADIAMIRFDEWPITDRVIYLRTRFGPISKSGHVDSLMHTFLLSQNGMLLQQEQNNFDLRRWTKKTYPGRKIDSSPLPHFQEQESPFTTFLPKSVPLDDELVKNLVLQLQKHMLSH